MYHLYSLFIPIAVIRWYLLLIFNLFLENRDELEDIIIDDQGRINDASQKIFSADVLQEKQEQTAKKNAQAHNAFQ